MTENMAECFEWLREHGFMATREETEELLVANRGREDGKAAGSWVIDGNTSDETCRNILRMLDDGDPALDLPELRLGEWADDPTFEEILADLGIVGRDGDEFESDTELFSVYSDAWYEGMQTEVERACRARIGADR